MSPAGALVERAESLRLNPWLGPYSHWTPSISSSTVSSAFFSCGLWFGCTRPPLATPNAPARGRAQSYSWVRHFRVPCQPPTALRCRGGAARSWERGMAEHAERPVL